MIVLAGFVLLILLFVAAAEAKKRGVSGGRLALLVVAGLVCVVGATLGILAWGFSGFG